MSTPISDLRSPISDSLLRVPAWLKFGSHGSAYSALAFVVWSLVVPPALEEPPTDAPAGQYYDAAQLAAAKAAWMLLGRRDALLTLHDALQPARIDDTRRVLADLAAPHLPSSISHPPSSSPIHEARP